MNVLITGGASGLGEALTRLLAADKNNTIYFTYNNSQERADKILSDFTNARSIKCDFGNAEELGTLTDKIPRLDLDVLINNAYKGEFLQTYFHKMNSGDFETDFKNNILPVVQVAQAAIQGFRKKKQGKIITILTSALSETPPIGASSYISIKAYLEKLTKVWANENIRFNITSNSVSPSFMETTLTREVDNRMVEEMKEKHPLKKLLTVEEVAHTVQFLMNASLHINGQDIVMNAGKNG